MDDTRTGIRPVKHTNGRQGLTTVTVRGFTTSEFYRNGFPINRGYPNMPDANRFAWLLQGQREGAAQS